MIVGATRGSFPIVRGEAPAAKRARLERWLIQTHDAAVADSVQDRHLDPEYDAVMAQPEHSAATRPSQMLAIRARCWQCVSGDDDEGGTTRIANCATPRCPLWSVRPYQDEATTAPRRQRRKIALRDLPQYDLVGKALATPGSRPIAIRGYCHDCQGGRHGKMTAVRDARNCSVATCALWPVRPGGTGHTRECRFQGVTAGLIGGEPDATRRGKG